METIKQDLYEAEQAFEFNHSSKVQDLLEKNQQYIASFKPAKVSLDSMRVALALKSIESKKYIFFTQLDYNPNSKFYSPINDNISFPYAFNIPKNFGFNSLDKDFCQKPEFTEIKPVLKKYFAKHKFCNPITKEKLEHLTRMLRQKYPELIKIPLILNSFCDVDFGLAQDAYYSVLKQESLQTTSSEPTFDFMKMAVFFCKICKLYFCDLHYHCDLIKNRALDTADTQTIEQMYFLERSKRLMQTDLEKFQTDFQCYHLQLGHPYLPLNEESLAKNTNFMLLLNLMVLLNVKNPCIVSKIFNIDCLILRSIYTKYKSQLDRKFYLKDYLDIVLNPEEQELELYPRALTFSSREIRNLSILFKIDAEFEQKFSKKCSCTVDCYKISETPSSKKQPPRCPCSVQGQLIRTRMPAEHLQVQLLVQSEAKKLFR